MKSVKQTHPDFECRASPHVQSDRGEFERLLCKKNSGAELNLLTTCLGR